MTNDVADVSGEVVDEAIGWMVATRDGLTSDEQSSFQTWLAADLRHRAAWQRLDGALRPFRAMERQGVSGEQLVSVLSRRRVSRRTVLTNGAGGLGSMVLAVGVADRFSPLAGIFSDFRTATGQRRHFQLPDGSVLALDARSEADRRPGGRGIALRNGVALVDVRPASEPFVIDTGGASASIAQGRFMMSRRMDRLRMICLRGGAWVTFGDAAPMRVAAVSGYEVSEGRRRILAEDETRNATSWLDGRLILHDRSMGDLIDAFRPYRAGVLSISAEAARLPVSGMFDLKRLDDTLTALPELFNVRVTRIGDLFARIAMAQ